MHRRFVKTGVMFGLTGVVMMSGQGRTAASTSGRVASALFADDRVGGAARSPQNSAPQAAGLRILVVEGESAVNIIQQKTAVAPIVEVRDRNDQPVAGAVVRFAIRSGRATFNGTRALTVTTNAAGRAAVTGFAPTGTGALQISASATFQGQTAAITIAQTNVMTAAQAASAASAAGAGGGGAAGGGTAGGAAAGAGGASGGAAAGAATAGAATAGGGAAATAGGISATTIAVVGGAAAGGTLVAVNVAGSDAPSTATYSGSFSAQAVTFVQGGLLPGPCTNTHAVSGDLSFALEQRADGTVGGTFTRTINTVLVATTCPGSVLDSGGALSNQGQITGTTANVQANAQESQAFDNGPQGGSGTWTRTHTFSGALSGGVITGTFTTEYNSATTAGPNVGQTQRRSFSVPVTLTLQ